MSGAADDTAYARASNIFTSEKKNGKIYNKPLLKEDKMCDSLCRDDH